MVFLLLTVAIVAEVFGSTMLKTSEGFKKIGPSVGLVIAYITAFYTLSIVLQSLALGTAYAIWAGAGTALTAVVGILFFREKSDWKKLNGIALITIGVILLNLGGNH